MLHGHQYECILRIVKIELIYMMKCETHVFNLMLTSSLKRIFTRGPV